MNVIYNDLIRRRITEYAIIVNADASSYLRSQSHSRLCDALGMNDWDYSFRPFEDTDIIRIPSISECEGIIYNAIKEYSPPVPPKVTKLIIPKSLNKNLQ